MQVYYKDRTGYCIRIYHLATKHKNIDPLKYKSIHVTIECKPCENLPCIFNNHRFINQSTRAIVVLRHIGLQHFENILQEINILDYIIFVTNKGSWSKKSRENTAARRKFFEQICSFRQRQPSREDACFIQVLGSISYVFSNHVQFIILIIIFFDGIAMTTIY